MVNFFLRFNNTSTNKQDHYFAPIFIVLIICLFCWWSNPSLIPKMSPDSWGYINLSEDFSHDASEIRSCLFPLFIKFCRLISDTYWPQIFSVIQILFHSVICFLLFHAYLKFNFNKSIAVILTLIIGFNPALVYYTTYILADHFLAVITTLACLCSVYSIELYNKNNKINIYFILTAILTGLSVVIKPIAILVIVPILLLYIFNCRSKLDCFKSLVLLLVIHFSFHVLWEQYKIINNPKSKFELLDSIEYSINMTSIRGGLIEAGKGTPLYNSILKKNLLDDARKFRIEMSYTMDTNPLYWKFNKELTWKEKNDKEFAISIINNNPIKLFLYSISNWHAFFTKRSFGFSESSFPGMPEFVRYIYIVGYSFLYRPLLLILVFITIIILVKKKLLTLLFSYGGVILYASLAVAILTPHGSEFARYRVWVEYILWFLALLPLGFLLNKVIRMKRNKK
ncbi:MAG: hypothetical protein CMD13_02650 [Flavobacteriales bacterium]|nr:hypothetical protein [Flavobacteriales bacterium]